MIPLLTFQGVEETGDYGDGDPVDSTAVLCCWKHLVEVSDFCSQDATPEVVVVADLHVLAACARASMRVC